MKSIIPALFIVCICTKAFAQEEEEKIDISFKNITLKEALDKLGKHITPPASFSFNNDLKEMNKKIEKSYSKKTAHEILQDLLSSVSLSYKIIGNNIIIYKSKKRTLSGYIKEGSSEELLPSVTIYVAALQKGVTSNSYGFYSLTLPEGIHEVTYSYLGFETFTKEIDLSEKDIVFDALLNEDITDLDEVVLTADKKERISKSPQMSTLSIPIKQIQEIPALLGEKDVLKSFQLMPGVAAGVEGSSGLYVRGGSADQNLIILDDATVYNASHLFGFLSVFNSDALKSVELYKGAFPARYGGRLSSVIDMKMLEGDKNDYHGNIKAGLLTSSATLHGPIKKGKSSFLISGRRNYIDLLINPFLSKDFGKPIVNFYDVNAKINHEIDAKNKLYLSSYFGRDNLGGKFKDEYGSYKFKTSWGNLTSTLRWNHQFNSKVFMNTSLIYSHYDLTVKTKEDYDNQKHILKYTSKIDDIGLKSDLDIFLSLNHHIKTGVQYVSHFFNPGVLSVKQTGEESINIGKTIDTNESAFYVEDQWTISDKLKANIGLRASFYTHKKVFYFKPEPRISLAYRIKKDLAIKGSYASMNQYVHLLTSSGLALPTDLWVPSTDKVKPQASEQFAIGLAKDFTENNFSVSLEGYYKKSKNIIGYKEGANFLSVENPNYVREFNFEEAVTSGKGWAYGGELLIQRKYGKLTGWIGYTLSWSQRQFDELNYGRKFFAKYDRRHDASIVAIYKLNNRITFSGNWIYNTGSNYTLPNGIIKPVFNFPADYLDNNTSTISYTAEKNNFRGESTHRLDLGVQFHKQKKTGKRTWDISFYNVYNRLNPSFYYIKNNGNSRSLRKVALLGIIPSISYKFEF